MKKFIACTLSAILTGTLVSGNYSVSALDTVPTEHGLIELNKDLIVDGGFEGKSSLWKKTGDGQLTDYEGSADTGRVCGLLPSNSANASVYQLVDLNANTEYVAKARILVAQEGQIVNFVVKSSTVENIPNFNAEAVVTGISGPDGNLFKYKDVEFTFNSQNNTKIALAVMKWTEDNNSATFKGQAYVDNMSLKEKGSANSTYEMVWADDFNKPELDTNNWGYELGSIRGVEQQHYVKSSDNTFMRDGKLVLKATDRAVEDQYKNPRGNRQVIYNSGSIRTHGKQEFLYGRIEMKAKLPKGKGVFPAFWTLGSNFTLDGDISDKQGNPWSRCGEIDIMELTGGELGTVKNKQAWGTPHFYYPGGDSDKDTTGSGGKNYQIGEDYNNDYHVFGINWSPDKIEWYVDGVIYNTLDFSNPTWGKYAKMAYSQPQYIQFNLAMGGNWPGDAGTNLAGTEFDIDYVYYAQNAEQKAAAKAYYDAAPNISGLKDIKMTQGEVPDILKDITSDKNSFVDFSIDNEYMFKNEGGLTNVDKVCSGKDDAAKLAKLPAGKYNIHYTAMPNDVEYVDGVPNREKEYKMTRRTVLLTVEERVFPKDITLNGVYGEKLSSVTLPENWTWDNAETVMSDSSVEYTVNYENNGFETTAKVKVQLSAADKTTLKDKVANAKTYLGKDNYTSESIAILQAKVNAAQVVLDKATATKAEVTTAINDLNNAISGLVEKPDVSVDKTTLKEKLAEAKTYLSKDIYTSETLAILQTKVNAAQLVLDKTTATKAEVTTAINDLNNAITGLVKKPVTPPNEDVYDIVEDKQQTVVQGKSITFKSNASIEKFKEVLIDGKVVDKKYYTVKEGSTIITLNEEYTKLLSSGEHTITIVSTDGNATTKFAIEKNAVIEKPGDKPNGSESLPETSDNTPMTLFTSLATITLTGIWVLLKRKENEV